MIKATFIMPHPPIILPEIGKGAENDCHEVLEGLKQIGEKVKALKPKTIIVITPHGPVFSDGIAIGYDAVLRGSLKQFGYPNLEMIKTNNLRLVDKIIYESGKIDVPCLKLNDENASYFNIDKSLDHGTIVPLSFIDKAYTEYELVHITYGLFTSAKLYEFGMTIQACVEALNEDCVVIASGDLSHCLKEDGPYKYHASGALFDQKLTSQLLNKDVMSLMFFDETLQKEASECGKRSFDVMLGTLDGYDYQVNHCGYQGPFGVGYLVMGFEEIKVDKSRRYLERIRDEKNKQTKSQMENEHHFVQLARRAIEQYLGLRESVMDDSLTPEMLENRAGVFVSLKKHGALRGCIGTIGPTEDNIALEIVANAVKAGFEDPRFPPLEREELSELVISVDILSEPEVIDSTEALDVHKYGVIVTSGYKRGLLLPNLESIDTVEEQVKIACQKGSINEEDDFQLERFEVVRYQ